jgi:hypothetical protein
MGDRATLPVVGPRACAIACCALMLGGCLDTAVDLGARQASAREATRRIAARPGVSPHGASLAFASIEGPPDALGARFMQRFTQTAQTRDVALVPSEAAQYRLRAYLTASPVQGATRLAYVLDVFDRQGRRVQRLTDEAGVRPDADPWEAVDEKSLALFADRGAEDIAAFLSNTPEAIAAAGGDAGVSVAAAQHAPTEESPRPGGVAQLR